MATRRSTPRRTIAQQAVALRAVFPNAEVSVRPNQLVWVGVITPTPLARDYSVRVSYTPGRYPEVVVVEPALQPDDEGQLPHFYREGSLCLHEAYQWDRSMLIVDTIIPWTAEWLTYYELWKQTGWWYGNGEAIDGAVATGVAISSQDGRPSNRAERRREQRDQARRARRDHSPSFGKRQPSTEHPDDNDVPGQRSTRKGAAVRDLLNARRP